MKLQDMPNKENMFQKRIFLAFALIFIVLGIFITPDLLISLGPMRQALTWKEISVRRVAYFEVYMFRGLCILISICLFIAAMKWKQIRESSFVARINNHVPLETKRHQKIMSVWNPSLIAIICCVSTGIIYTGYLSRFLDVSMLKLIHSEDGIIEYASAIIFFLSSVFAFILSFKFSGHKSRVIIYRILSLGLFFIAGEEISWGQRIFNVETLDIMKKINVQAENNLHNLFGYLADHVFITGVFVCGFVLPFLADRNLFIRKLSDFAGLPIASMGLATGFLIVSCIHDWTVYMVFAKVKSLRMAELRESFSSIGFALLMYESWLLTLKDDT